MTKIAVFTDLHLPDHSGTVKEKVLEWALAAAVRERVDVIVAGGDLTSMGTIEAAERIKLKLDATALPYLITPGNAELRSPEHSKSVLKEFQTPAIFKQNGSVVVVLDSSRESLTDKDRDMLIQLEQEGYKRIFVMTHCPLTRIPEPGREFLRSLIKRGIIGTYVSGHLHIDCSEVIGKGEYHLVRGLDPDKAIGGPPALTFFEYDSRSGQWLRSECEYLPGGVSSWTASQRLEFKDLLGISCMDDSLGGVIDAVNNQIKNIEIRFGSLSQVSRNELNVLVKQWRKKEGKNLSIHFPDIVWDQENCVVRGCEQVRSACELALELGADALTMHAPRCPVGLVKGDADIKKQLLNAYIHSLETVFKNNIVVGIENLHMNPREKTDMERGYGYTPAECRDWIYALRDKAGSDKIGFHFDIGHARNNMPYSSLYNISQWFAELGTLITGYHLHQVEQNGDGTCLNHRPVIGMFGPLISFSSLFAAWKDRQINHSPMYLEIRNDGALGSLNCFRKYLDS